MQEMAPDFTKSKYFVAEPDWHILPDAPDSIKRDFEDWANEFYEDLASDYPDIKDPYMTWEGKVVPKADLK